VCPVKIPLPELLRKLRSQQFERRLAPARERFALRAWSVLASHPTLYGWLTRLGVKALARMGGERRRLSRLPGGRGWTGGRDMPAPAGETFRTLYARRKAGGQRTSNRIRGDQA
jgi:L-lactate dehydrogenase complex protein LldF